MQVVILKHGVNGSKQMVVEKPIGEFQFKHKLAILKKKDAKHSIKYLGAHKLILISVDLKTGYEKVIKSTSYNAKTGKFSVVLNK